MVRVKKLIHIVKCTRDPDIPVNVLSGTTVSAVNVKNLTILLMSKVQIWNTASCFYLHFGTNHSVLFTEKCQISFPLPISFLSLFE